jgi:hypothetical protein
MTCYEKISLLVQFFIFLATGTYAWFAWGQWRSIASQSEHIRRQGNIAEATLKLTRAELIATIKEGVVLNVLQGKEFSLTVENIGATTAFDCTCEYWSALVNSVAGDFPAGAYHALGSNC